MTNSCSADATPLIQPNQTYSTSSWNWFRWILYHISVVGIIYIHVRILITRIKHLLWERISTVIEPIGALKYVVYRRELTECKNQNIFDACSAIALDSLANVTHAVVGCTHEYLKADGHCLIQQLLKLKRPKVTT